MEKENIDKITYFPAGCNGAEAMSPHLSFNKDTAIIHMVLGGKVSGSFLPQKQYFGYEKGTFYRKEKESEYKELWDINKISSLCSWWPYIGD